MDGYNVGGADSSDEDVISSDDETGRLGRRLPRARYTTVDDDDHDEQQQRRPKRSREEAIYGVFMEDSDEDKGNGSRRKRRNKKPFFKETASSAKTAPLFVKGDVLEDMDEQDDEGKNAAAADDGKQEQPPEQDAKSAADAKMQADHDEPSPPTEEELAFQKQRQEANQQFLSLLDSAKRKRSRPILARDDERGSKPKQVATDAAAPAATRGIGSRTDDTAAPSSVHAFTSAAAMPALGLGMRPQQQQQSAVRKDPSLGTWEKHTKGIGMKLLSKMGYKGSGGLGSKRRQAEQKTGISRAVEVKVRPANLGLGFGGFREASTLKVNRKLEAQVRGEAEPEPAAATATADKAGTQQSASALPTADELLQDSVWQKGSREVKKKKVNKKRTVIPYNEVLESKEQGQSQMKIVDLRGPGAAAASSVMEESTGDSVGPPPLGEELLHNVSLLLNTHESKLHSHSQFASAAEQKLNSLESEVVDLERQQATLRGRQQKMEKASAILDDYEEKVKRDEFDQSGLGQFDVAVAVVKDLSDVFSPSDRKSLKFDTTLAPTLLGDALRNTLKRWNPLRKGTNEEESLQLINSVVNLSPGLDEDSMLSLRRSLFLDYVLPRIQKAYESAYWDAQQEPEIAIRFFEELIHLVRNGFHSSSSKEEEPSEDSSDSNQIIGNVRRTVIFEAVYPKLERTLSTWKPSLDQQSFIINPPHEWILPWVPLLDHPGILPTLMSQCKRRLESAASFLARKIPNDEMTLLNSFIATMKPWAKAFKSSSVHDLTSKYASERVAACLATPETSIDARQLLFGMHECGLMSAVDFLALLEFDLLRRCVVPAQAQARNEKANARKIAEAYIEQKSTLEDELEPFPISRKTMRSDELICRCFLSILRTVDAVTASDSAALDRLEAPADPIPYTSIRSRRIRDRKRSARAEMLHMEAGKMDKLATHTRARFIRQDNNDKATFREVVEDLCLQESIPFAPRTTGARTHVDGKQVFLFGNIPIYLDSDVVFAHEGNNHWEPVSLEALLERARD